MSRACAPRRRSGQLLVVSVGGVLALLLALTATPRTYGALTSSIANSTNTAASAVFGSTTTCQATTNVGTRSFVYPLNDAAAATVVADTSGSNRAGTYRGAPIAYQQPGPCPRDAGTAISINTPVTSTTGTAFLSGPAGTVAGPGTFSVGVWFRTSSVRGGRLIGFGNGAGTTRSVDTDRHLYLTNAGKVIFGVRPNSMRTVSSATGYNDDAWHYAVATLSPTAGATLYVDGLSVASDVAITGAQNITGQWRIGWDTLTGWPEAPTSEYFQGSLAWAAVHTTVLTAAQVQAIWTAGRP